MLKCMAFHHYVEKLSPLFRGPSRQKGIVVIEPFFKGHGFMPFSFCQESICPIKELDEF